MTRKIEVNIDSLTTFLEATRRDLLTVGVALHHGTTALILAAYKVNCHRVERLKRVLDSLKIGENLLEIDLRADSNSGDGK